MSLRWGFVGTGSIAQTVAHALAGSDAGRLHAIASRDPRRAADFAARHGAERAHGGPSGLRALIDDDDVDVVYVATPHPQHHAPARAALLAGKPVLVEKPLTVSERATQDLVDLSSSTGVFLMEAYWTRLLPGTAALLDVVGSGTIGEVTSVHASLGFPAGPQMARFHDPALGGGALLDLGPYPVGLAVTLLGGAFHVAATGQLTERGVDAQSSLAVTFAGGAIASLSTTIVAHATGGAWIGGTRGTIDVAGPLYRMEDFVVRTTDAHNGHSTDVRHQHSVEHGHRFMLEHVRDCLAKGLTQSPLVTHRWSLDVAHIHDLALDQMGVIRQFEDLPTRAG